MPGRNYTAGSGYRYGFNGQEKSDEIYGEGNAYDFGARIHDPRLGRWSSMDPHIFKYPNVSSYGFALNNPIFNVDFAGQFIVDANGNIIVSFINGKTLQENKKGTQSYPMAETKTDHTTGTVTTTTISLKGTWGFIISNKGSLVPVFVVDNSKKIKSRVVEKQIDGTSTTKNLEISSSEKDNYNCTTNCLIPGNNSMVIPSNYITQQILKEERYILKAKDESPQKNEVGIYTDSKGVIDHFEIYDEDGTVNSKGENEADPGQTSPNTKEGFAEKDKYQVYKRNQADKKTLLVPANAAGAKTKKVGLEELKKILQSVAPPPKPTSKTPDKTPSKG